MDDAATVFATACAVIAASTGMVLCFAPKNVNDAVISEEEEPTNIEDKVADDVEPSPPEEEDVKEEASTEPILSEESVNTEKIANVEENAADTMQTIPEQRPAESVKEDVSSPQKKKRRFTLRDRSNRIYETKPQSTPVPKKAISMKWLTFRSNKKNDAVNIGREI
jgi:hypothetical protein